MKTSLAVMLVVAACAAPSLAASGQDRWDGRLRSALDVNDPYYVHEGQSAPRSMRFAAEEPLFCRGKQCPLTTTAAGAPKCCPSRDACCPATYDCDESDAKITRCIPTASTPPASSSSTSSSNPEGASISVGSQPSTSSSSQQAAGAGAVQAANPAVSGSVQAPAAASSSQQVTGVQPVGAPTFSESSDPLPKFRQNIIIVKNINVLTKMQQSPDDAVKAAEESTSQQPQQGTAPVSAAAAGGAVF